jgi:hypothetical protein
MRRASRAILVFLFILVQIISILAHQSHGSAEGAGLSSGNPTIASLANVPADQALSSRPCTMMTIDVVQSVLNHIVTNDQQLCMISTTAGLMSHNGNIIQPNGSGKAYSIYDYTAGHSAYVPIPNQDAVLRISNASTYSGSNIYIYRNFYSHLHFNVLLQRFELSDYPEISFKYIDSHFIPFNTGVLSFSKNGQYMVTDVNYHGLVRINLNTYELTPFATDLPHVSGGGSLSATSTIDDSGRYVAVGYNAPLNWGDKFFRVVDIGSCTNAHLASNQYGTTTFNCSTANYITNIKQAAPSFSTTAGISFVNENVLLFDVFANDGTYTRYSLTASGAKTSLIDYLAMGDSYISGEGAYAYREGTDTNTNKCHQSMVSYPYLIGQAKFESFASVACSGAVIANIEGAKKKNETDYQLKTKSPPSQPEIDQASLTHLPGVVKQEYFIDQDNPKAVTLSIGGNDIKFSEIVERCIVPFNMLSSFSQNCYQTYEDRLELVDTINKQFNTLKNTYKDIKGDDPTRRVYVIGYPQAISATGSCGDNVRMSQSDREFAVQLTSYLDSVIEKAAANAGVYYVDTQHAFDGHKLCEQGTKAVNGLTAGEENFGILGQESYHPDAFGHQLLADTIMSETHGLTSAMPAPDSSITKPLSSDSLDILQVPHTNRTIYEILNAGEDLTAPLQVLIPQNFDIDQFDGLLAPNSSFTAVLHSDPVNLGTYKTDASGTLSGQLIIPAGVSAGFHTLHFYGKNVMGDLVDVQRTVFVAFSASDWDDDGIANDSDTCVGIPNSGNDVDKDGVDDACDGIIGDPPIETPASSPESSNDSATHIGSNIQAASALQNTLNSTVSTSQIIATSGNQATNGSASLSMQTGNSDVLGASIAPKAHSSNTGKTKNSSASQLYALTAFIFVLFALVLGWRRVRSN